MRNFKVYRAFDEFLKDPNISLRAKRFLTMVLTNNITTGFEVENYCSDTKEDIWCFTRIKNERIIKIWNN